MGAAARVSILAAVMAACGTEEIVASTPPNVPVEPEEPTCGCLAADPDWSCDAATCIDNHGVVALAPEAGFLALPETHYELDGVDHRVFAGRFFYSFWPADETPETKPIAVLTNGGPAFATSSALMVLNTGPMRATTSPPGVAEPNPDSWTRFANLLYVDSRQSGFSYEIDSEGAGSEKLEKSAESDAAEMLWVLIRFLQRHPQIRANPVVLVAESYGGTRAPLMLSFLYGDEPLDSPGTRYRNPQLLTELVDHFAAIGLGTGTDLPPPGAVSTQFGHQVLIQPFVGGDRFLIGDTIPPHPDCVGDYILQCDDPDPEVELQARTQALFSNQGLSAFTGVHAETIEWLLPSFREHAFRVTGLEPSEAAQLDGWLGPLEDSDGYFLTYADGPYGSDIITSDRYGYHFLRALLRIKTLITHAPYDMSVESAALLLVLESYDDAVVDIRQLGSDTDKEPEWLRIQYVPEFAGTDATRFVRFPFYEGAGHMVTARRSAELLADLIDWYGD
jgi:serine carboxypeptidase